MEEFERLRKAYLQLMHEWLTQMSKNKLLTIDYLEELLDKKNFLNEELSDVYFLGSAPILECRKKLKIAIDEWASQPWELEQIDYDIRKIIESRLEQEKNTQCAVKRMENPNYENFEPTWRIVKAIAAAKKLSIAADFEKFFKEDLLVAFGNNYINESDYPRLDMAVATIILACVPFAEAEGNNLSIEIYKRIKALFRFFPWTNETPPVIIKPSNIF